MVLTNYGEMAGKLVGKILIVLTVGVIVWAMYEETLGRETELARPEIIKVSEIYGEINAKPLSQGDLLIMQDGAIHLVRYHREDKLSVSVKNREVIDLKYTDLWYFTQIEEIVRRGALDYNIYMEKFGDP